MKRSLVSTFILFAAVSALAGSDKEIYNSGGILMPEQAAYDVTFYDLTLSVNPDDSTIQGTLRVDARIISPLDWFVLDLDSRLVVTSVKPVRSSNHTAPHRFERRAGQIWTRLERTAHPGDKISLEVAYSGKPLVAPEQPGRWSDGFLWTRSKSGEPWLGVVSVLNGADIWWPCKDHPSDEADSMAINITVPEPLTVAANGRLRDYERFWIKGKRMHTFHWFVSSPINNYGVTLNIAQYSKLEDKYRSINGELVPIVFWVMPEDYVKAMRLFPQFAKQMLFLERLLGPYPFRAEQYSVAQTRYIGMEHQTLVSYGANFQNNKYGFDRLHFHELSHEWFANQVTAPDWRDWWLHEGVASYLEALYAESLQGLPAYHEYIAGYRSLIRNQKSLAPLESQRTRDIYGSDLYTKGAWFLHTLRYLIGKENVVKSLRKMTYPDPQMEYVTDGRQCRFATTEDFRRAVEEVSGQNLKWFFDAYLHQPGLPRLVTTVSGNLLVLRWDVPNGLAFPMPVEVRIGSDVRRIAMGSGQETVVLPAGAQPQVDPDNWILKTDLN